MKRCLTCSLTFVTVAAIALDVRFARPVHEGDTVEAGGCAIDGRPGAYEVWVRNQEGMNVIEGEARYSAHDGFTRTGADGP